MEVLSLILQDFWSSLWFLLCLLVLSSIIKDFFDFIVELIHGKQVINNYNLPKEFKVEDINKTDTVNKTDSKVKIDTGKVKVRESNGKKEN